MSDKIEVVSTNVSQEKGTIKKPVDQIEFDAQGIVGDAHAGDWHRQISILASESIDKMIEMGANVSPGDFAENITTEGIDVAKLPIGTKLKIAETVELEVTQIGKECHSRCEIFHQVGDCIMPREGIFAKVVTAGNIKVGDTIEVLND